MLWLRLFFDWFAKIKIVYIFTIIAVIVLFLLGVLIFFFLRGRDEGVITENYLKKIQEINETITYSDPQVDAYTKDKIEQLYKKPLQEIETIHHDDPSVEKMLKAGKYIEVFVALEGQYNVSDKNPEIKKTAEDLADFIKKNYPEAYLSLEAKNPEFWVLNE